ncbi:MAG: 5-deoxy-glucuronate isomerase [Mobilicoccus sp.]|nr:5-deoxy-glucuronate isomerase [Mobilicoccus sp.]
MTDWIKPAHSTDDSEFDVAAVRPGDPGWNHTGLLVADLADGESRTLATGECEYIVLPLAGAARVSVTAEGGTDTTVFELAGRADVFSGPTDLVYAPRDAEVTLTSVGGGRYALPFAKARRALPVAKIEAADVPVELRGAGQASRQVQNFGTPGTLEADSIIACEVITPAGNWSSYPPHKHDEHRPGQESELEEIYYFEMRAEDGAPTGADPIGYQRVYGTDERPIDVLAEVRSGDVVLVPHGWHGPAMAPTGYDMYYLNVMAGPGEERIWLICDDPAHGWVRDAWPTQQVDPRLPLHEH